jgi:apolipoprotein D and lipocalin family protein
MAKSPPAGRFTVSFDGIPKIFTSIGGPNYHVIHVDSDYRHAVVGIPSRKALWILSRSVPVAPEKLAELTAIARDAGFDTSKLIVAPWR